MNAETQAELVKLREWAMGGADRLEYAQGADRVIGICADLRRSLGLFLTSTLLPSYIQEAADRLGRRLAQTRNQGMGLRGSPNAKAWADEMADNLQSALMTLARTVSSTLREG